MSDRRGGEVREFCHCCLVIAAVRRWTAVIPDSIGFRMAGRQAVRQVSENGNESSHLWPARKRVYCESRNKDQRT
jgi:hypothetical protein